MAKTYRPFLPEQDLLLPPSVRDWLPEDHLEYFVSDLVDQPPLETFDSIGARAMLCASVNSKLRMQSLQKLTSNSE